MSVAELDQGNIIRAKKVAERVSENLHVLSNEPSLALYRLQEHVRKSMVQMVVKRYEAADLKEGLTGTCYDIENAIQAVGHMRNATTHLQSVHEHLKTMMFLKQQLDHEEARKESERLREQSRTSSMDSVSAAAIQEMRKSKSVGVLRPENAARASDGQTDVGHVSGRDATIGSTGSTPISEDGAAEQERETGNAGSGSSTPTSGCDSHVSDDFTPSMIANAPGP